MREGPERHTAYLPSTLPSALHPLASSGKELIERARKLSTSSSSSLPACPPSSAASSSSSVIPLDDETFKKKFGEFPQQSPLHIADAEFISNGEAYRGKLYVCQDFVCLFAHTEHPKSDLEAAIPLRSISSIYPGCYSPEEFPLIRLAVDDPHLTSANAVMLINHDNKVHQFFNFESPASFEAFLDSLESAWRSARCCDSYLTPTGNSMHFSLASGAFVAERSLLTSAPHAGALSPARAPQTLHPHPPTTGVSQPTAHRQFLNVPTSSVSSNIHPPDDLAIARPPSPKNAVTSSMIPEEELPLLSKVSTPVAPSSLAPSASS